MEGGADLIWGNGTQAHAVSTCYRHKQPCPSNKSDAPCVSGDWKTYNNYSTPQEFFLLLNFLFIKRI